MKKSILLLILALTASGLAQAEPVSAIAAIGSIMASGATTVGLAGLTSLTLANGLLFAGGAIGLLGSVTKNKKLTALGGVLSLGGGIGNLVAGAGAGAGQAAGAAGEATGGAGAQTLSQTGFAPIEAVKQGVTQGVEGAASAGGAAEAAGTMGATAASGAGAGFTAPLAEASGGSLLDKLVSAAGKTGSFIKANKELVNLGGGLIKGAAEGYAQRQTREDQAAFLREQQQRYSNSVTGINPTGQFVNPNANITAGTTVQDPTRYVPNRGLIRSVQGV